ncbi:MAG: YciI family protein [Kofleriaceae bacterium]
MFIIELTYLAPLAQIDAAMKRHMAFLDAHYAAGTFVVSGRKIPRDGGIIVAIGSDRAAVEAIVRDDPFVAEGLAMARVIEFRASQIAEDMPKRLAAPTLGRR